MACGRGDSKIGDMTSTTVSVRPLCGLHPRYAGVLPLFAGCCDVCPAAAIAVVIYCSGWHPAPCAPIRWHTLTLLCRCCCAGVSSSAPAVAVATMHGGNHLLCTTWHGAVSRVLPTLSPRQPPFEDVFYMMTRYCCPLRHVVFVLQPLLMATLLSLPASSALKQMLLLCLLPIHGPQPLLRYAYEGVRVGEAAIECVVRGNEQNYRYFY